jgi:serine/threonine-protein kinase HipA
VHPEQTSPPHRIGRWVVVSVLALAVAGTAGGFLRYERRGTPAPAENPVDRFDREGSDRIGYISAMTLLEAQDGQSRDYTEIAEAIPENSSAVANVTEAGIPASRHRAGSSVHRFGR